MIHRYACAALLIAIATAPVAAAPAPAEIDYPKGSLGFQALMSADYETAEAQLRQSRGVDRDDPARLINLGSLLARTGREAEGVMLLEQAAKGEDIELILGDGRVVSSREAAQEALAKLKAR